MRFTTCVGEVPPVTRDARASSWHGRVGGQICVAVPGQGRYAVAVRHDSDGNGHSGWSDGGGFSRNPSVSLLSLRPSYDNVAFNVTRGVARVNITLLYRYGLSIRPAA